jgi:hypothetical protein
VNISPACWKKKYQERLVKFGPERPAVVWKACHHDTTRTSKNAIKVFKKIDDLLREA